MRVWWLKKRQLLLAGLLPALMAVGATWFYLTGLADRSLAGQVVVVDAGHGGIDPGGNRPGIAEKDINLAVALQLRDILAELGVTVVLTRDKDTELSPLCDNPRIKGRYRRDLAARTELIAKAGANLFVSLHCNVSANQDRRGVDVFYFTRSPAGKKLADCLRNQLVEAGIGAAPIQSGNYFVLRQAGAPAVLIELGYITNPQDRQLLTQPEYQRQLARAIAAGIQRFCDPFFIPGKYCNRPAEATFSRQK